jgi:predicted MFS family arabinose efflux permease
MTIAATAGGDVRSGGMTAAERKVIFASSLGTVFEWYDFYIYGTLGPFLAKYFFSSVPPAVAFIFTLLAFAAGFAVRPFGALIFGRLGDMIGRKYTFLITMSLMGVGTFFIGLLPSYATWGLAAPIVLIALRLVQGLALGGEYGGAATYVAEHAPKDKRGYYTSWIQTTATLGLFLALLLILGIQRAMGEDTFGSWGWRIPFLASGILLIVSIWIRLSLNESPVFQRMKEEGKTSRRPLTEAFGEWRHAKIAILALLGATAGEAVVWYGGQFYALFFLTQTLKVPSGTAWILILVSLALGTPFFVLFGWLSDKIGRKPIILVGFLLAAVTYFPIFKGITHFANPKLEAALASSPVTVIADPSECSFQFKATGTEKYTSGCDIAKSALINLSVNYTAEEAPRGTPAQVKIGDQTLSPTSPDFAKALPAAITKHGYPASADPNDINYVMTVVLLWILVVYVTLVYAPIAAWLVELFPSRIRYSGMSLPYHIGNGWFGGFLPALAFAIAAWTGNIYSGLWYPVGIAAMSLVIGFLFLPETKDVDITKT